MKKSLVILTLVAAIFTACEKGGDKTPTTPIFPEPTAHEIEANTGFGVTFDANFAWTVSLSEEDSLVAYLFDGEEKVTSVSGVAGEGIRVFGKTYSVKNYDEDITFTILITMDGETRTLATYTIKKIEKEAPLHSTETLDGTTLTEGAPSWGGEFKGKAYYYFTLNYGNEYDAQDGVSLQCDLEYASIKCYSYNAGIVITDASTMEDPYVTVTEHGNADVGYGFRIKMDVSKESAKWSLSNGTYEAYANICDANGNILVSIYCTYTPQQGGGNTGGDEGMSFAYPNYVSTDGSTLARLETTDPLYAQCGADKFNVPAYLLTFVKIPATLSAITGPNTSEYFEVKEGKDEWLSFEYMIEASTVGMSAAGNGKTGWIYFYKDEAKTQVLSILVCQLKLEEE